MMNRFMSCSPGGWGTRGPVPASRSHRRRSTPEAHRERVPIFGGPHHPQRPSTERWVVPPDVPHGGCRHGDDVVRPTRPKEHDMTNPPLPRWLRATLTALAVAG